MRKIKEVLRLKHEVGCGNRDIAKSCGIGRTSVSRYLRRAARAGLSWPIPSWLDETQLERLLFPPPPLPSTGSRPEPDWSQVHQELRRKGVTLALLWEEYKAVQALGYQYSWFCERYREWSGKLGLVTRTIIPNRFKPAYHNGPLLILAKVKHNRRRVLQFLGRMPSDGSRWRPTEDLGSRG